MVRSLTAEQIALLYPKRFTFTSATLAKLEACPAACVFNGPKSETTGGMWYGIFVHRFLEYVTSKGPDRALAYIRSKAATGKSAANALKCCEKIDLAAIPMGEAEVGYAHDVWQDTSRRIFGRHDWAKEHEAYGKADLLFYEADGTPHVADYKCGWLDGDPNDSTQLYGLACAVRAESNAPVVKVSLVGVASDGALHWNTAALDEPRLDYFRDRLQRTHLQLADARDAWFERQEVPEFRPGSHCNSCHNQKVCPAVPPPQRV